MRRIKRISRIQFIAAGGAFLASCSGLRSGSAIPGGSSRTLQGASSVLTVVGHDGNRISSSKSGHAVAMHMSSGELVGSIAVGPEIIRYTDGQGRKTFISAVPRGTSGWHHLTRRTKFMQRTVKGKVAVYGIFATKNVKLRVLLKATAKGYLVVRMQQPRVTAKIEWRSQRTNAQFTTSSDALASIIDAPGAWAGDDDFIGTFGAQKRKRATPRSAHRTVAAQRRTSSVDSDSDTDSDCSDADSDVFDTDFTDFGDPGGPFDFNDPGLGDGFGGADDLGRVMHANRRAPKSVSGAAPTISADERAFILCLSAASLSGPIPVVPFAIVLAKLTYHTASA